MPKLISTILFFLLTSYGLISYAGAQLSPSEDITHNNNAVVFNEVDTYEDFNRAMFAFNMTFNDTIGKPLANTYKTVLPQPVRNGASNFFANLKTPLSAFNCFLQGKPEEGFSEVMRFTLNSTFGFLGLLDIAEPAGLEAKNEDFGQTLYKWGLWQKPNYLVLPFIGPYTTRHFAGSVLEGSVDPVYENGPDLSNNDKFNLRVGSGFVSYTKVVDLLDEVKKQPDPYIFSRESFFQYRKNKLYDGNPPQPELDDFNFE